MMAKYYYVNGHTITHYYVGKHYTDCWCVDGDRCYYMLTEVANACGVSYNEIIERVYC